jgi:hypothetical protein
MEKAAGSTAAREQDASARLPPVRKRKAAAAAGSNNIRFKGRQGKTFEPEAKELRRADD